MNADPLEESEGIIGVDRENVLTLRGKRRLVGCGCRLGGDVTQNCPLVRKLCGIGLKPTIPERGELRPQLRKF